MKTKTVPLADILWKAANNHLSPVYGKSPNGKEEFSCHAAYRAAFGKQWRKFPSFSQNAPSFYRIDEFLSSLGCEVRSSGFDSDRYLDDLIQGVRYMWLLIAMHCAEDEGVMVEVPA